MFPSFLLRIVRLFCKRLHQFKEICTVSGCESLKKEKSQGKAVEVTVNSKEENS
jgi:hypothetical protein